MLEDKQWFESMISKKNKLMAEQHAIISSFLHERKIYNFPMSVSYPIGFLTVPIANGGLAGTLACSFGWTFDDCCFRNRRVVRWTTAL